MDAVISTLSGGFPTGEAALTAAGAVVATSFDSSGNYTLTGTPSAYPVAIVYRVRQTLTDYDYTASDIIGDYHLESVQPVSLGGTGATDALNARANLGLAIGSDVQAYSAILDGVVALAASTGIAAKTSASSWAARTNTGTAAEITVTNGDGVSGNPTFSLPAALTFTGKTITGGTFASPSLTTPSLGVATATSINKLTITAPATSATLTIADGKTFTSSNTLTLAGTDGSTLNIGAGGTLGSAAFTAASAYEVPLTFSTGLTRATNTITVNTSQNISTLSNLTSNGIVTTSGGTGALSVTATTGSGSVVLATSPTFVTGITTPLIIGGTSTTQTITYKTTTGVGATGADHIFQVGNNGATEAMRILNSGFVGIGTSAPTAIFTVSANSGTLPAPEINTITHFGGVNGSAMRVLYDAFGSQPSFDLRSCNGTASSPSQTLSGGSMGQFSWYGYGSTGYSPAARIIIRGLAAEDWTDSAQGTYLMFRVTATGAASSTERLRISGDGYITVTGEARITGDIGGAAASNTITGTSNVTANSTGVGTILFKGTTSRDSSGFIKIYVGTTAYYVPIFSAITG